MSSMRRFQQPLIAALIACSLVVGSCGTESDNNASPVDDVTAGERDQSEAGGGQPDALAMAAEVGDIDLSEDEARLVAVEAEWLCRAQRFSFGNPNEMTTARDELLATNGVTAEQYTDFQSQLANRRELREAVLAEFAAVCLKSD